MHNDTIEMLRHYLATLAFRLKRVTDDTPDGFAKFEAGAGVRTPLEILRHMSQLMSFTEYLVSSIDIPSLKEVDWNAEVDRFASGLASVDKMLISLEAPERATLLKALQGPLSDAMTHIGQLATLRRMAGAPIEGVSYAKAEIKAGQY